MKKGLILAVALVLMAASVSFAVIAGSRHDLTSGTYYSGAQVSACQFCHTPHLRNYEPSSGCTTLEQVTANNYIHCLRWWDDSKWYSS
jgi:hypothetical protein